MPLVHRAVRAEEIEVLLAFHVPHMHAFPTVQHHGKWVVVVRAVRVFQGHQIGGAERGVCVHATKIGCALGSMHCGRRRTPYFCTPKARQPIFLPMATNRTFTMIKPDATGAGNTGKIIDRIIEAGFTIKAMKWTQLSMDDAAAFYAVHKERPFFGELTEYMTSGPIVAAILEKDNAVADFRTLIGATNPAEAAPGTIRADFAQSIAANAVHGSDSDENAAIEGAFYFSARELA